MPHGAAAVNLPWGRSLNTAGGACLVTALLASPAAGQAQFNCTTNNGAITITGCTGFASDVAIPATINVYL